MLRGFCQEIIRSRQVCPHEEQRRRVLSQTSGTPRMSQVSTAKLLPRTTTDVSMLPQCGHAPSLYVF